MIRIAAQNLLNQSSVFNIKNSQQALSENTVSIREMKTNFRAHHFGLIDINADKKTNNISFSGMTCILPEELQVIKTVLSRCRYMEDIKHILNSDKFKITPYKNVIVLDDFYSSSKTSGNEIRGLCSELCFKVAEELEKLLGSKYKYLVVSGSHEAYKMTHYCIAVCKNTHNKNFNNINSLTGDTLIIDPAFGLVGLKKDNIFKDYVFKRVEDCRYSTKKDICYLYYEETDATLLGKVKLLAPGLFKEKKSLDKNALIRFLFAEPYNSKPAKLYLSTNSPAGVSYLDDATLNRCLSEKDLLKQWINKVNKSMQPPVDEIFLRRV